MNINTQLQTLAAAASAQDNQPYRDALARLLLACIQNPALASNTVVDALETISGAAANKQASLHAIRAIGVLAFHAPDGNALIARIGNIAATNKDYGLRREAIMVVATLSLDNRKDSLRGSCVDVLEEQSINNDNIIIRDLAKLKLLEVAPGLKSDAPAAKRQKSGPGPSYN